MGAITLQRILLADDEPDILEISRIALETVGGFEVSVCSSGKKLLERLSEFEPDLVIVDVLMPDMTGPEVFEEIRRRPEFDEIPVIYLTGVIQEEELEDLRKTGVADVILKPFDPMTLADRVNCTSGKALMEGERDSRAAADQLEKELERLRGNFLEKLPVRLQTMVEEWNALQGDGWSQDGARALHRSVHGLIGTAGSLGFAKMAKTARRLERRLVALLEGTQPPTPEVSSEVIERFERMGEDATSEANEAFDPSSFENVAEWGTPLFEPRNLIVVVEQEDPFARELALQLGHFGFELQIFKEIDELVSGSVERRPAAVIMDLSAPDGELMGEEVATKVRDALGEAVPLVLVSNRSDIEARLDAVRAGCSSYFIKPVNYSDVLETLDRLTRSQPEPYRILIVDDETDTADFHATSLEVGGPRNRDCYRPPRRHVPAGGVPARRDSDGCLHAGLYRPRVGDGDSPGRGVCRRADRLPVEGD